MKRCSVLVLLLAIIFSTANLVYKQTHYAEVKETEYGLSMTRSVEYSIDRW